MSRTPPRLVIPGMAEATDSFFEMRMALAAYHLRLRQSSKDAVDPMPAEKFDRGIEVSVREGLAHLQRVCDDLARFVEPLG